MGMRIVDAVSRRSIGVGALPKFLPSFCHSNDFGTTLCISTNVTSILLFAHLKVIFH